MPTTISGTAGITVQRAVGAVVTDNDISFSLVDSCNFTSTISVGGTLTFTDLTAGQSGNIVLTNVNGSTISKAAHVKCATSFLGVVGAAFAEHPFGGSTVSPSPAR